MGTTVPLQTTEFLSIRLLPDYSISIQFSAWFIALLVAIVLSYATWRWLCGALGWKDFEIDRAEIGLGSGKLRLKPNLADQQIAYAIWVELSTRKIGLQIDFDHDVIIEVYDSWYSFFAITRDLVKSVPVRKIRSNSTQEIVKLSIEVLNHGLRPHLTQWQARFRNWYGRQLENQGNGPMIDPQDLQRQFPQYRELSEDIKRVNRQLIGYRNQMQKLVIKD